MKTATLFSLLALIAVNLISETHGKVVICQYASWAVYRNGLGKFTPDMIDTNLCTHAVYVSAGLDDLDQLMSLDPWADLETGGGLGGYKKFTDLKLVNPNFKPMLALGNFAYASTQFSAIAADPTRRARMAQSAVTYLKSYGFVGLEVDWLYPVNEVEKNNFPLLLADLKAVFDPEGFEIIITGGPLESTVLQSYNLPELQKYLNYIVMIGYDYAGAWDPYTGLSTPLYVPDNFLCVNATVNAYLSNGGNASKLVLGFPGFARTYTLLNNSNNELNASVAGPGRPGTITQTGGILSFNEVAMDYATGGWTLERDSLSQAPYTYKLDQWISGDDETSIAFKADYCNQKGLAGGAIWTIDDDNFQEQQFTLLRAISLGFNG